MDVQGLRGKGALHNIAIRIMTLDTERWALGGRAYV